VVIFLLQKKYYLSRIISAINRDMTMTKQKYFSWDENEIGDWGKTMKETIK